MFTTPTKNKIRRTPNQQPQNNDSSHFHDNEENADLRIWLPPTNKLSLKKSPSYSSSSQLLSDENNTSHQRNTLHLENCSPSDSSSSHLFFHERSVAHHESISTYNSQTTTPDTEIKYTFKDNLMKSSSLHSLSPTSIQTSSTSGSQTTTPPAKTKKSLLQKLESHSLFSLFNASKSPKIPDMAKDKPDYVAIIRHFIENLPWVDNETKRQEDNAELPLRASINNNQISISFYQRNNQLLYNRTELLHFQLLILEPPEITALSLKNSSESSNTSEENEKPLKLVYNDSNKQEVIDCYNKFQKNYPKEFGELIEAVEIGQGCAKAVQSQSVRVRQ